MFLLHRNRFQWTFALLITAVGAIVKAQETPVQQNALQDLSTALAIGLSDHVTASVQLSNNQLGIEVAVAEKTLCSQLGIQGGLVITKSPEGSEGAKAGLQAHDVILNINSPRSQSVLTIEDLNNILTNSAGQKIEIGLLRGGKMQLIGVTVPQRQDLALAIDQLVTVRMQQKRYRIGIHLAEADETLRAQLQLPSGQGLVVTEVIDNTPAAKAGFQAHDVIIELDGKPLGKVEEINQRIQETKSQAVAAKVLRGGKSKSIEVTPEKVAAEEAANVVDYTPYFLMNPTTTNNQWQRVFLGARLQDGTNANFLVLPSTTLTIAGASAVDVNQPGDPRAQVTTLKQQLAEMQKVIASLEATLSATEQKPAAPAAEEKK